MVGQAYLHKVLTFNRLPVWCGLCGRWMRSSQGQVT